MSETATMQRKSHKDHAPAPLDRLLEEQECAGDVAPADQAPAVESPSTPIPNPQSPIPAWQPDLADLLHVDLTEIPIGPLPAELIAAGKYHITRHVEVGNLTVLQSISLRRLVIGLDLADSRLANGKRPASVADAVRWLLERLPGVAP